MSDKLCLAQEWQRDGRGLWAMRSCRHYDQHSTPHDYEPWCYNVQPPAGETPAQPERVEEPPLMAWMTAETSEQRDAAFLRMYAAKVLDRTAVTWEIPNTVATTLTDIANRIEQRSASLMGARVPHPETEK